MGASSNVNNVPQILKYIWDDEVFDYQYEGEPYYAKVEKDTSWTGLQQIVTMKFAHAGGRSGKFTTAKKNKRAATFDKMTITTSDNFAIWSVDNKLITLTRDQKGSLVRALTDATADAQLRFKKSTVHQLWRNGGGAKAKIATGGISGAVATLDNGNDVRFFELGDVCEFAHDDGVAGGGVYSGTLYVVDIDEDAGTLTFNDNLSTINGLVVGDYIFEEGDYNSALGDGTCLLGVPAYVTLDAPGSSGVPTTIWGMTRTTFPTRQAGHRFTGQKQLIIEEIKDALTKAKRRNCQITEMYCSPETFNDVEMSLEGSVRRTEEKVGRVGFTSLVFVEDGREVKLTADPNIPLGLSGEELIFGLNMDTWKLHTAEEWPMWMTADGEKKFLTEENANAREGRIGGYGQHYTNAAGQNFVLALS